MRARVEHATVTAVDAQTVLVVEDDTALSELVAGLLTNAGYHPVTIADHALIGAAVRSTGESRTWDDAIAIRGAHPTLPVVIFTADRAALTEVRAGRSPRSRAAGFAGIVSKPFVIEEFLATVRGAVEGAPVEPSVSPALPDGATAMAISVFPDVGRLAADWPDTDLFGTIVHELRGHLTVIRGQVQLALKRVGRDEAREREAMDSAIAQVDRMEQLITELLDHARMASNGLSLSVVVFDLVDLLVDAIAAHEFETTPRFDFRRSTGSVYVHGDPGRIAQILDNLLGNALKYSPATVPIEVTLTTLGTEVQIRVADHGVGIPEDERVRLFTPFFRASTGRDVRGTGLGLHISKQLAERHAGRLWLDASSSTGSVFALALPIASASPSGSAPVRR